MRVCYYWPSATLSDFDVLCYSMMFYNVSMVFYDVLWCSTMFYVLRAFLVSFCWSVPSEFVWSLYISFYCRERTYVCPVIFILVFIVENIFPVILILFFIAENICPVILILVFIAENMCPVILILVFYCRERMSSCSRAILHISGPLFPLGPNPCCLQAKYFWYLHLG